MSDRVDAPSRLLRRAECLVKYQRLMEAVNKVKSVKIEGKKNMCGPYLTQMFQLYTILLKLKSAVRNKNQTYSISNLVAIKCAKSIHHNPGKGERL